MFNQDLVNQLLAVKNDNTKNQKEITEALLVKAGEIIGSVLDVPEDIKAEVPKPVKKPLAKAVGMEQIMSRIDQVVKTNTPITLPTKAASNKPKTKTNSAKPKAAPKVDPYDAFANKLIKIMDKYKKSERPLFGYLGELDGKPAWSNTHSLIIAEKYTSALEPHKITPEIGKYPDLKRVLANLKCDTPLVKITSQEFKEFNKDKKIQFIYFDDVCVATAELKMLLSLSSTLEIKKNSSNHLSLLEIKGDFFTGALTTCKYDKSHHITDEERWPKAE